MLTAMLEEALASLSQGDRQGYALNVGKAAGFVLAGDLRGLESLVMYDEISDSFEKENPDAIRELRQSVVDLYENSGIDEARVRPSNRGKRSYPSWDEYGSALNEALEAKESGDSERYALMVGLSLGMMFRDPGRKYPDGSISTKIARGYETDSFELLQKARAHIMTGIRMTAPISAIPEEQIEKQMDSIRRVQNFGARIARGGEESVRVPVSTAINLRLLRRAREARENQQDTNALDDQEG